MSPWMSCTIKYAIVLNHSDLVPRCMTNGFFWHLFYACMALGSEKEYWGFSLPFTIFYKSFLAITISILNFHKWKLTPSNLAFIFALSPSKVAMMLTLNTSNIHKKLVFMDFLWKQHSCASNTSNTIQTHTKCIFASNKPLTHSKAKGHHSKQWNAPLHPIIFS